MKLVGDQGLPYRHPIRVVEVDTGTGEERVLGGNLDVGLYAPRRGAGGLIAMVDPGPWFRWGWGEGWAEIDQGTGFARVVSDRPTGRAMGHVQPHPTIPGRVTYLEVSHWQTRPESRVWDGTPAKWFVLGGDPTWTPSGRLAWCDGPRAITTGREWVNRAKLRDAGVHDPHAACFDPCWSPDGSLCALLVNCPSVPGSLEGTWLLAVATRWEVTIVGKGGAWGPPSWDGHTILTTHLAPGSDTTDVKAVDPVTHEARSLGHLRGLRNVIPG